jgi:phosphatidylserine decarboxylase
VVLSLLPYRISRLAGALFFLLVLFCLYFFRDPERDPAQDPSFILAPGDGRVLEVAEEKNARLGGNAKVVRIFLSIFDVHVQRSPISGRISEIEYRKGKFYDARHPSACLENERNSILIEGDHLKAVVVQIAGFIARRIVCWVRQGEPVRIGGRLGLIRFGSQVDLFLPENVEICVKKGDRVAGGMTVVAISRGVIEKPGVPVLDRIEENRRYTA